MRYLRDECRDEDEVMSRGSSFGRQSGGKVPVWKNPKSSNGRNKTFYSYGKGG